MLGDEVEVAEVLGGQWRQIELGRRELTPLPGLSRTPFSRAA